MRKTTVADLMSEDVVCIDENMTFNEAAACMLSSHQTIFPVVDQAGAYKGIVSVLDLLRPCFPFRKDGVYPDLGAIFGRRAGSLTRPDIRAVSPDETVEEAAQHMLNMWVKTLPVVHKDRVVGIITAEELVRLLF
jgi:CBS-domain-containing membrane protein